MTPLFVIDMQTIFTHAVVTTGVIAQVAQEITRAVRRSDPVIFVEMAHARDRMNTEKCLLARVPGKPWRETKLSLGFQGYLSDRAVRLLNGVKKVRMVGIYADQCLRACVEETAHIAPNVQVYVGPIGASNIDPPLETVQDKLDRMAHVTIMKEYDARTR